MKTTLLLIIATILASCATSRYIQPAPLKKGDVIGVVSLSSRMDPKEDTARIRHIFDSLGFALLYSDHLLEQSNERFGANDSTRAAEFMRMIESEQVKAVLCYRGGYGIVRILDYIDWKKVRRNPKWIAGYSDVTMLHLAASRARIQTIHSNMPTTFKDNDTLSLNSLRDALTARLNKINIEPHPQNQSGVAEGRLVGGNLSILYAAAATPEDKVLQQKGNILFIEDVGENAYHIDRMLQNLYRSGKLARYKAIIVGYMTKISDVERFGVKTVAELISQYTSKYKIPVIFGMPVGHDHPNLSMYMGRKIRIEVNPTGATIIFK